MSKERELDFASGYCMVFPCNFRDSNAPKDEPFLYIKDECPEDMKEKILKTWEKVKIETKERHKQGVFSSNDYF